MKYWAMFTAHVAPIAVLGILAFFALTRVQSCRDSDDGADAAVMAERIRVDSIRAVADSIALAETRRQLDLALANGVKVVDRWHNAAPPPIVEGSAHDTITQQAKQIKVCRELGDSLVQSVVEIQSTCKEFRDTATKTIAGLKEGSARKDSLLEIVKRGKRVQAYGDLLYEPLKTRPVVGAGFTTNLFWKLDGKVEAQYAIPRAKPDGTDGFRLLAGAHIRF